MIMAGGGEIFIANIFSYLCSRFHIRMTQDDNIAVTIDTFE